MNISIRAIEILKMFENLISYVYFTILTIEIKFCKIFSFLGGYLKEAQRRCCFIRKLLLRNCEKYSQHFRTAIYVQTNQLIVKTHPVAGARA